jgi:hypothetical protein|tara:strand:+ start:2371 stop:2595 length:225 start_codon:yes stop_codon:yes gene_type:complete
MTKRVSRLDLSAGVTLEEALDLLYRGKANAVKLAAAAGVPKTELQRVFADYVSSRGLEPNAWQKDDELSWPYTT